MPLITQPIKSLKGGVSQQPDILRFSDQGQEQINGFSSEVHGLQKRPPSVHLRRITESQPYGKIPMVKMIDRDVTEKYYLFVEPDTGAVFVIDLQGNVIPTSWPNGLTYSTTPDPRNDIRAVTIADYTFIINRKITVAEAAPVAHPGYRLNGQFLLSIKGGQYARTYKVILNGTEVASHTTPDGSLPAHAAQIDTQYITDRLGELLTTALAPSGWILSKGPSWIKGVAPITSGADSIATIDGFNGGLLTGVTWTAQRFNMLPAQAPHGYVVKITGDPGTDAGDYYVAYNTATLTWDETARPLEKIGMDPATMPHVLVREAGGTFTFRQADWDERTAGDLESNPMPSFVGGKINDVFFFRNRLGLLSGENVIMSRSGEFFSFFPKSVVAVPDTDPVDVAVSHARVSTLNHAVPFNEELLLWSDQTQFVLRSDGVLSPRSVKVDPATEFENAVVARPIPAGRSVYFASPRATHTSIRRYYAVQEVSAVKNAEDVTAHVPSYIPNGVFSLVTSTAENVLCVLTSGREDRIYLYKYLYMDEQLVQQSWGYWQFSKDSRVLACEFVGSTMHLLRSAPDGMFIERVEFTQNTKDLPSEPYRVYADRKVAYSPTVYHESTNKTQIPLGTIYGQVPTSGDFWVIRDDGKAFLEEMPGTSWGAGVILLDGDQRGRIFTVGEAYEFRYDFSKFLVKITDQTGTRSETTGRLQLRRGWLDYENSGPFTVHVGSFSYTMTGVRPGVATIGAPNIDTGRFDYPLMGNADDTQVIVKSINPTPLALIGGGWMGNFYKKAQAI